MTDAYRQFLEAKIKLAEPTGFDIALDDIHPLLKPHQRVLVQWGVKLGRAAWFAAFGLGKTVVELETARIIRAHAGGMGLIVAPLGVRQEFARDAAMLGQTIRFVRSLAECDDPDGLYLTNYETIRAGKLDPAAFTVAILDEASVLRSFGSDTFKTFMPLFAKVRFRFVATATPSPNRYKELIHYAGFLGVMDTGQALTRFFQRDSAKAGNLTLYPHKEEEFWLWVASWAAFLQRPSDLGFSDEGYDLPELDVRFHEIAVDAADHAVERDGQGLLFRDAALGVQSAAKEKRDTLSARVSRMAKILAAAPRDHWLIWHDLEAEREAIEVSVPGAVSIYGSQDLDVREQAIIDFSNGRFQYLAAKPVIAGSGCNFQRHCHKAVFLGVGFKFNDFIQAVHRIQRFLQRHPVEIHIIYAESEREVLRDLLAKWARHKELVAKMAEIIRKYGLMDHLKMAQTLVRHLCEPGDRIEAEGEGWLVVKNDCVREMRRIADNSIDLIVTSIPFSNHYEYTPSYNDFGHTDGDDHFFTQMDFLTPQLLRVLKPGRLACIHVKDRILFGSVTGYGTPTVNPFHAKTMFHCMKHGFAYMGLHVVQTDVVRENNQTYRLGYTEMRKDGTKMGAGSPEFVLLMRKLPSDRSRSYADDPVTKAIEDYSLARWQVDADAIWRSSGERLLTPDELAALPPATLSRAFTEQFARIVYDHESHVKIGEALLARGALPSTFTALNPGSWSDAVWTDVNRMLTLNGAQTRKGLENHICPLQFDIVDRLIRRFSAPGELVFDPFGGLFTVPLRALKLGRAGRAAELNPQYFLDGVKYLEAAERELSMPSLFQVEEIGRAA